MSIPWRLFTDISVGAELKGVSRDSVVDIATGYGLDDWRVWGSSPVRVKNFLFTSSRPALGTGGSFPGSEAGHSPPTSTGVKKMWAYTSTPPYAFIA
jgi:hypothetical protein